MHVNRQSLKTRNLILGIILMAAGTSVAGDWPQWRGPERNGVSKETGLLQEWPEGGPKLVWQVRDLGNGYSTPAVAGDKFFLISNKGSDNEYVEARSAKDGKQLWSAHIGKVGEPKQQPNYPAARSTPTVDGNMVYALGSDGDLACFEAATGKIVWQKNVRTDYDGKPGEWAYSESPLVDGDMVICSPGAPDAAMIALNKKTGELIWKSSLAGTTEASFSSAIIIEAGGQKQYAQLLQKGLVGVEPQTGKVLWHYDKPVSRYGANIPTPVASNGRIYVGSVGTGGGAVKLVSKDGMTQAQELYFSPKLPSGLGGTVEVGGYLYGTTGQALACVELATGEIKWQDRAVSAASICYADGRLYLNAEDGEVVLVEPSPKAYLEKGRFKLANQPEPVNKGDKNWAYPVVANGRLYLRYHGSLWCYAIK